MTEQQKRKDELQGRMVFHTRMRNFLNESNKQNVVMKKYREGYRQELEQQIEFHNQQMRVTKACLDNFQNEFKKAGL